MMPIYIFYDDVQLTSRDWRTRNKIKTPRGTEWITVPVGGCRDRLICEVELKNTTWQAKHWETIRHNYAKCPYFTHYQSFFEEVYLDKRWMNLSEMNQYIIPVIAKKFLGISTEFHDSREYSASGHKAERLLELVKKTGASRYISGPAAKDYIDPLQFTNAGIELVWKDYSAYPEYPQRYPPFEHGVSILDLLFNVGPDAPWFIWGWREGGSQPL